MSEVRLYVWEHMTTLREVQVLSFEQPLDTSCTVAECDVSGDTTMDIVCE
jgi:hypothetical protein